MSLPILTDVEVNALSDDRDPGFGCLQTPQGSLPLREMSVKTEIEGLVFHTRLRQVFVNPLAIPLDASYIFPLPERAAVTHFQIEINDRVVNGVIQERQQARQNYEQAIQTGQRAAITEEERAGVFTIRVGNLLPGETAILTLQLVGPLPFDGGEVTYRFPLVVAPRYIPGIPLPGESVGHGVSVDTDQVPDASRISPPTLLPGYPHPIQLSLAVTLRDRGFPLTQLRSSLHNVVTEASHEPDEPIGQELTVRLLPGERLNRDFILRWQIGSEAVQTQLLITPDPEDFNAPPESGSGTFSLTVLPPTNLPKTSKPRDVVLLLDRSGSMKGWKIVAARRAAARMIDSLSEQDRFAVIAFDDRLEMPFQLSTNNLTPALDRFRYRAVEFLSRLEARGGTQMLSPLQKATQLLSHTERDPVLVLVTDAQVGNEDQMLRNLNLKGIRFFGVGIDQAVNAGWLTRLAQVSGGAWELVESEDRLDEVMTRLHQRINTPLVSNLQLEGEILSNTLVPKRLPALFAGTALTVSGRYQGSLQSLVLRGIDAQGTAWQQQISAQSSQNSALPSIWARGQVRELEDQLVIHRDPGVEAQLISISLAFQVLCRFTAYLAVDEAGGIVNPGGHQQRVIQPVEPIRQSLPSTNTSRMDSHWSSRRQETSSQSLPQFGTGALSCASASWMSDDVQMCSSPPLSISHPPSVQLPPEMPPERINPWGIIKDCSQSQKKVFLAFDPADVTVAKLIIELAQKRDLYENHNEKWHKLLEILLTTWSRPRPQQENALWQLWDGCSPSDQVVVMQLLREVLEEPVKISQSEILKKSQLIYQMLMGSDGSDMRYILASNTSSPRGERNRRPFWK